MEEGSRSHNHSIQHCDQHGLVDGTLSKDAIDILYKYICFFSLFKI